MAIKNLNNPFIVSKHIPEELFCDRKEETSLLIKQIENGRNVVLVSPRRMGKTGLLYHLLRQQEIADNYNTFYIDIYPASSLKELTYIFGKAVFERLKSKRKQHLESFFQVIKSLRPGFKIDAITGEPKFELGFGAIENPETTLDEIFSYLESSDKPCIVAFDEFQQIADFQEKRVEALLRGKIQNCSKTFFLFSGSKQHTISQMFHSKAKPFYQSAQTIDLHPLDKETYSEFAKMLFAHYEKHLSEDV
ncbi:MAG: ATP-binding protein, partial [Bacteroidales bacterium]|nr:ATP-binding protein [Bacteroidales bacterium]